MSPIRITHLTTSTIGGAGVAALRLHQQLVDREVPSQVYFRMGDGSVRQSAQRPASGGLLARIAEKISEWSLQRRTRSGGFFTLPTHPGKLSFGELQPEHASNILHLHWISRWFDWRAFFATVPATTPIVWSLHDLNPLTGGCHIPGDCRGFVDGCRGCPQIRPLLWDRQRAARSLELKRKIFQTHPIHVVANSRWMLQAARDSSLGKLANSIRMIHLGVDCNAFQPRGKSTCRELLGVPHDKFILAFGAADLNDDNKSLKLVCDALQESPLRNDCHLLLFGKGWPAFSLPVSATAAGWTDNERLLSVVYSAADVLVMPSRFESFGLTAVEAMSCGIPAIATRTGGLSDIVRGENGGISIPVGDAGALRQALERLFTDTELRDSLGRQARLLASDDFSLRRTTDEYISLYRELSGDRV